MLLVRSIAAEPPPIRLFGLGPAKRRTSRIEAPEAGADKLDLSEVRWLCGRGFDPTSRMGSVPCATLVQEGEQARQGQRDQNFHVVAVISCVQRSPRNSDESRFVRFLELCKRATVPSGRKRRASIDNECLIRVLAHPEATIPLPADKALQ